MKKLAFFLFCMSFSFVLSMNSNASDRYIDRNGVQIYYDVNDADTAGGRAMVTRVYAPSSVTSVTIPDTLGGYPVVSIGPDPEISSGAFGYNKHLQSISLPDSVCQIYQHSFSGLRKLKFLSVNGDGIVIDQNAFRYCNKLQVEFRGNGAVKYISGYVFDSADTNSLDFNVIKGRVNNESWIGYDETWKNEAEWKALVNSLTPFSVSVTTGKGADWTPEFEELTAASGYTDPDQIRSNSISTEDYKAWIRKAARWVDSNEEQSEVRIDVAYNIMSEPTSNDMVFVLDVSRSMYYSPGLMSGSNYSRQFLVYDQARSVAKALLDLNETGTIYNRVGATMFGSHLRGTSKGEPGTDSGMFKDYASFIRWLDKNNSLKVDGTNYSPGLDAAVNIFNGRLVKSRNPSVLFLSDGEPNEGYKGAFPGTSIIGYGGTETTKLSKLGATRYCILLGPNTTDTLTAVTNIAGMPGTSSDSTRTFVSPDADTLKKAFKNIMESVADNLSLELLDTAGNTFEIAGTPAGSVGTISVSGSQTDWDLNGASPGVVYTITIVQNVKRNNSDHNAYFHGEMETNLGNTVLLEAALGSLLEVDSPKLTKTLGLVNIRVHVFGGTATALDGTTGNEIIDTITETGSYTARYQGDTKLKSINVSVDGGATKIEIDTLLYEHSYTIDDIRTDYDIYVEYKIPGWSVYAQAINGTISPAFKGGIALGGECTVEYSPMQGYYLYAIYIDGVPIDDLNRHSRRYQFIETTETDHYIIVEYKEYTTDEENDEEDKEEDKDKEKPESWGDYRN